MSELIDDGYPTDKALKRIKNWPLKNTVADSRAALEFAASIWHWPDFVTQKLRPEERKILHAEKGEEFIRFATGGWSGNEDIIDAIEQNRLLSFFCWQLSAAGGLHIYRFLREDR